jgi:hypothetical protein
MTTTRRKVVYEFTAEEKDLLAAMAKLQEQAEQTREEHEKLGNAAGRAMNTIGLGAEAQVGRLQRLNNAFQGLTGKIASGADSMAKAMAPWNQALELGGKAIKFLDSGLDAAAKKYPSYAKDVAALKDQFSGLKESAMAAVGVMTVELLKPAPVLDLIKQRIESVDLAFAKSAFFGGFQRGQKAGANWLSAGDNEASSWDAAGGGTFDEAAGYSFFNPIIEKLDKDAEKAKQARERAKKLGEEQAALAKELADQAAARAFLRTATTSEGRNLTDTAGGPIGWSTKGLGASADSISRDIYGNDAERAALDRISKTRLELEPKAELASKQKFLESAFGSIDEINAHDIALKGLQITFGGLTTAVNSSMQAWISGSMSLGLAIKKGIGDALAGVASQMAIEALKHGAFALGSLAFFDFAGAAKHGAAAAAFGAGAVTAAAAARKLGASVNAEVTAQKEAAAAAKKEERDRERDAERRASGLGGSGGQTIVNNTIVYGEHFYSESTRMRQLDAERFVQAAVGSKFVEHS